MTQSMKEYKAELYGTQQRLVARLNGKRVPSYGPETPLEEVVTMLAQVLGAKDPYLVVLYPERLEEILKNEQPDWMDSGWGLIEIEGTP